MLPLLYKVASVLFSVAAIAYMVQVSRLYARAKRDHALWQRLGEPSLFTISGQKSLDRVLFRPELESNDPLLILEAKKTRVLLFVSLAFFAVAVVLFFLVKHATGA